MGGWMGGWVRILPVSKTITVVMPTWNLGRAIEACNRMHDLHAQLHLTKLNLEFVLVWSQLADVWVGDQYTPGLFPSDALRAATTVLALDTPRLPVQAMSIGATEALRLNPGTVLAFIHDDVIVDDPTWASRSIALLSRDHGDHGVVGWGGALGLGTRDIYKRPYDITQLQRIMYMSNVRDAETHGARATSAREVVVLDGFSLILHPDAYLQMGGWRAAEKDGIDFHMYDAWLACRMAELGLRTAFAPVGCLHAGGGTSVARAGVYEVAVQGLGYESGQHLFDLAHTRIYERFRNVLPLRVPGV